MGINQLNANLLAAKKLIKTNVKLEHKTIYVDFNCLFYTTLNVCCNYIDLKTNILKFFNNLSVNNYIVIFYDSGNIYKKRQENAKRELSSSKLYNKSKNELMQQNIIDSNFNIRSVWHGNNNNNIVYRIPESDITYKKIFTAKINLDKDYKRKIFYNILKELQKKTFITISKKNIDAEFLMFIKAKEYFNATDIWPIFHTKDQDLVAFLTTSPINESVILFDNVMYNLITDTTSFNIAIVTLFFNKSDYFSGIHGYMFDSKKLDCDMLNILSISYHPINKTSIVNLIKKVLLQNEHKKFKSLYVISSYDIENINNYIDAIILYMSINLSFYSYDNCNTISLNNLIAYINNYDSL